MINLKCRCKHKRCKRPSFFFRSACSTTTGKGKICELEPNPCRFALLRRERGRGTCRGSRARGGGGVRGGWAGEGRGEGTGLGVARPGAD